MAFEQIRISTAVPKTVERPISPALVVGLGGTGKEVLLRLRRLIVERFGSLSALPCIEFLHIDTDQKQTAKEQYDFKADDDALFKKVKFNPNETIPLTIEGGAKRYISHIDKYPNIKRWFHHRGKIAGLGDLGEGAGQIRMASRLAFFHEPNFTKIADALTRCKSKLQDPTIIAAVAKHDFKFDPKSIEIYVITSTGGGTGSGIFLDMGFLIKDIFDEAERVAVLFMPKLYEGYAGHPRIYANGYAALMELNKYSFGHKFLANWKGHDMKEILPPPFTYTYFLDAVNETGFTENNEKAVYQMSAEAIFQDYAIGGFAAMKRSTRVNLVQYTMNVYVHNYWEAGAQKIAQTRDIQVKGDTYPARFSSLGLGVISFPVNKVHSACACRLAQNILKAWENKLSEDPLEKLITKFLTVSDISFFQGEYDRKDGGGRIESMDIEDELLYYNKNSGQKFENYIWEKCLNARKAMEAAPKGNLVGILQEHRNRFEQLMTKEDSEDPQEWGEDIRLLENNKRRYLKQLTENMKREADRLANSPKYGIAYALAILKTLKELLPKGKEEESFKYLQHFEESIPAWKEATTEYLGHLDQLQLELDKHDRSFMFRKEDIERDLHHIIGSKTEPGVLYNYMFARVMKQVVKRGKQICQEIDEYLGKDSATGKGILSDYHRLIDVFAKLNSLFKEKEKYFSRDFYTDKGYTFWASLYKIGDVDKWYERWMGRGEIEEKHIEELGNRVLSSVFQVDSVTLALKVIEKTPEEEIEDRIITHCKVYFVGQAEQPSALEILMDTDRFTKTQQEQLIKRAYDMARVWVKGGGVEHVNVHSPESGQKPYYIGVDGNDIARRKDFLDIVEKIKGAGEITQALDIGSDNKASIVFYNELAGITAFYPHTVSAHGGLKQRYSEFYSNTATFDPDNQEELHTDKNRFQFNDLIPKTDEEAQRYKDAVMAFVLARMLGMLRVEEPDPGMETFEQIFCYEYRDPYDNTYVEMTFGDEYNTIDMLYRDTSKKESWRAQILDKVEEKINTLILKKMLAHYLLLIEFYQREVYPPHREREKDKERGDMIITRYSPQYAILEQERRRIYEQVLIDPQNKQQAVTALNALRGRTDAKGMEYTDYVEVLKPFTKKAGMVERIERKIGFELKSVPYKVYALDFSKLGLEKEKSAQEPVRKIPKPKEPVPEEKKPGEPEAMTRPCPVCGNDINVRAIYCLHCQKNVSGYVECSRCGETKVPDDLKHCWRCGYLMEQEEKIDCPRCYSWKGQRNEFPCKVCGYNFEPEQVEKVKTAEPPPTPTTAAREEEYPGPIPQPEKSPAANPDIPSPKTGPASKPETTVPVESAEIKPQKEETSTPKPAVDEDSVECQNCFSVVKKGPRCPICQAPLGEE